MSTSLTRRGMLEQASCGFGFAAFAGMATSATAKERHSPMSATASHHPAKAKRVIFLCMRGGPSHVDTFDHKPQLAVDSGKTVKKYGNRKLLESPWKFRPRGESGLMISELFPNVAQHADDLRLLNGMYADVPSHPECFVQLHTGSFQFVRPSVGAWVNYGLGSENENLPGFITLCPPSRVGGTQNYGSAFLPAVYQGTAIGSLGQSPTAGSIKNLRNSRISRESQRDQLDLLQSMNHGLQSRKPNNPELEGVIESYELAFRMQTAVPDVMDLAGESQVTKDMYGIGNKATSNFGYQCLLARRFAERGVRYIECTHANWDQHGGLRNKLAGNCLATDQPIAALLTDLKNRGMLEDTLVVWGGEFGRTPHVKNADGRDHNSTGFTFWMAGGGIKGGMQYGATDEHGIAAIEDRVHFHDLHATMLHMLGLNHERLTYRYAGRDFRLTDVYGNVVKDIIA